MPKRAPKIPKSVASYYRRVPGTHLATILEMRARILEIVPRAEEVISYGMPAFKVDGNVVAGLLANKFHIGYYPFSGSILHLFKNELKDLKTTKSAIHVSVDKPLSKSLLKKLISARISQCPVRQGKVNLAKYEKFDGYWKSIGLAAPARRGLIDNGLVTLRDLKRITKKKLIGIHGMGPNAIRTLEREMKKNSVKFKLAK